MTPAQRPCTVCFRGFAAYPEHVCTSCRRAAEAEQRRLRELRRWVEEDRKVNAENRQKGNERE